MNLKIILEFIKMNINYRINRVKVKLLNPPIETMTNDEKEAYISNLLFSLKKSPENVEKLDEVISTLDKDAKSDIAYMIEFFININKILPEEQSQELFRKLYLKWESSEKKISDLTAVNCSPYNKFALEILESVIDVIGKEEIEFILLEPFNPNVKDEMKLLISKGFDLDYIYDELDIKDFRYEITDYLSLLPTEKIINYIEKRLNNDEEPKNRKEYMELIDFAYFNKKISKFDKIYLEINASKGKVDYFCRLDTEELIQYIIQYGIKTLNLEKKFESEILYTLINKSSEFKEDYERNFANLENSILESNIENMDILLSSLEEINDLKDKEELLFEANLEKFSKFSNEQKKDYLLSNSNQNELNTILKTYMYEEIFESAFISLSKEEIISIVKSNSKAFKWLLRNPNVSLDDMLELLKDKEIILDNTQLFFGNEFVGKVHNTDDEISTFYFELSFEDVVNLYNFNEKNAYSTFFEDIFLSFRKNMTFDRIKILVNILDDYYASEEYLNEKKEIKIGISLTEEVMRRYIKEFPDKIDFIDFSEQDEQVLFNLYEDLKEYKSYNAKILRGWRNKELLSEEMILTSFVNYLKKLSKEECSNFDWNILYCINDQSYGFLEKAIFSGKIDRNQLAVIFDNNTSLANHFSNIVTDQSSNKYEQFNTKIYNFLLEIDESGDLLKLYKSIDETYMKKLIKGRATKYGDENPSFETKRVKQAFLSNIFLIYRNKEDILKLMEKNPNLLYMLNYKMLKVFDMKDLEFYSKYEQMKVIDDKVFYVDGLKEKIQYIKAHLDYPQEQVFKLLKFCSKFDSKEQADEFWKKFSLEEVLSIINQKDYVLNQARRINIHLFEDIRKFSKERIENIINNTSSTKEEILEAFAQRFFSTSYKEIDYLINCYGADIDILLERYTEPNLSNEEQIEKNYLLHFKYLKEIFSENDCEILKEVFTVLDKDPEFSDIDYLANLALEEKMREIYTKEKKENLYIPAKKDMKKDISYKGSKIKVYEPKEDFNILISVVGAYVTDSKIDKNPFESWNQKDKNLSQDICCSIIGNDNLSMALLNDGIKLGFVNFDNGDIRAEAPYDLASNSSKIELDITRKIRFYTIQNLKDNIRTGHSEHLLERFVIDENGDISKRQPDYIIAINRIREKDLRAAKEFNVPIVLLNTREISKRESQKLQELKNELLDEKESFSIEKLKRFIVGYHNNYSGMYNLDKKSIKKYFNTKKMKKSLQELADRTINIEDLNSRRRAIQAYLDIINTEEEKYLGVMDRYVALKFDKIKEKLNNSLKEIEGEISERPKRNDMDKYKVKTEDLYNNFISAQKNLNDSIGGR